MMENTEIKMRYRDMAPYQDRIGILSELNACTRDVISGILGQDDGTARRRLIDKDLLARLYLQGMTDKEMANETGYILDSVQTWRARQKLPANIKRKVYFNEDKARALYNTGLKDPDIAAKLFTRTNEIFKWRKRNGLIANTKRKEEQKSARNKEADPV